MARVAFIGLGVMGSPMAGHLAAKGHDVTVYNRTASRAEDWLARHGGSQRRHPRRRCRGRRAGLRLRRQRRRPAQRHHRPRRRLRHPRARDAIFVDHTTASAAVARELADAAAERGAHFIDAPVSGGQAGAEKGALTVMCGGDPAPYARAEPVIMAYARACRLMGPAGSGQLTKMVNQITIAGLLQGLSEGLAFATRAGLDGQAVLDVIGKGAAGSWQMENRGPTMLADKFDFGFAVDWMRKDLGICLAEAEANGASLPVTALVDQFYKDVQRLGGGRWDTSSLIRRLA